MPVPLAAVAVPEAPPAAVVLVTACAAVENRETCGRLPPATSLPGGDRVC